MVKFPPVCYACYVVVSVIYENSVNAYNERSAYEYHRPSVSGK